MATHRAPRARGPIQRAPSPTHRAAGLDCHRECQALTQRVPGPDTESTGARHKSPHGCNYLPSQGRCVENSTSHALPRIPKSSDANRKTPMLAELCAETEASQKITTQPSHPCSNKCRLKYSSMFWRLRVSMVNYTLTELLLFSAGAILVNYIYVICKDFRLYEFGRWRQPLPWPSFSMEKKNG